MQPRTTAWLALVALALGAFIYLFEIRGGEERARTEAFGKRIFPAFEDAAVDRIELTTGDGRTAVLERRRDRWQLVEPLVAPASDAAVEAILSTLEDLERESRIDAPDDLEPFGLGAGAPTLGFEGAGQSGRLVLGGPAPVGAHRYVLAPGSGQIDLVRSFRLNVFDEPLDELRDKRVLPFETAAISRVRARWPGSEVALERREDGWWMTEPVDGPADASSIETLLADVAFLGAEGFIDDEDDPMAAGLDEPAFALLLEGTTPGDGPGGAGGEAIRLGLAVGDPMPRDASLRAARGRGGMLFEIAAERLDDWPRRVVDYRDKTLSQFDVSAARTFELVFHPRAEPGKPGSAWQATTATDEPLRIQAELADGGWVSTPLAMSPERAAAFVAELAHLEGIDIVAEAMGEAEREALGLRPGRVVIRVWGEGDSGAVAPLLAELSLGDVQPGRGVFAKRRDADLVYLLDPAMASEIPLSAEAFRRDFLADGDEGAANDADVPIGAAAPAPDDVPEI